MEEEQKSLCGSPLLAVGLLFLFHQRMMGFIVKALAPAAPFCNVGLLC